MSSVSLFFVVVVFFYFSLLVFFFFCDTETVDENYEISVASQIITWFKAKIYLLNWEIKLILSWYKILVKSPTRRSHCPSSVLDFIDALVYEWEKIPESMFQHLLGNIPETRSFNSSKGRTNFLLIRGWNLLVPHDSMRFQFRVLTCGDKTIIDASFFFSVQDSHCVTITNAHSFEFKSSAITYGCGVYVSASIWPCDVFWSITSIYVCTNVRDKTNGSNCWWSFNLWFQRVYKILEKKSCWHLKSLYMGPTNIYAVLS